MNHDDVIKWKHFPRNWPFVRKIHRSPVNFPHKGQWRGALMFSLIYAWINNWVNNREAGDLRRQDGHYDVIVMITRNLKFIRSLFLLMRSPLRFADTTKVQLSWYLLNSAVVVHSYLGLDQNEIAIEFEFGEIRLWNDHKDTRNYFVFIDTIPTIEHQCNRELFLYTSTRVYHQDLLI